MLRSSISVALVLAACGTDPPPATTDWDGTMDTLAGGRTVVTNGGRSLWSTEEAWVLTEDLRIGSLEGEGPDVFGQVRAVELDTLGRLYVLDSQARQVRVFDAEGSFLRSLGRPGQGPGELEGPAGLAWGPRGNLVVADTRNARYTAFDVETGEVAWERRRPMSFFMIPWRGGFDREGKLTDVGLSRVPGTPGLLSLIRLDGEYRPIDTLLLPTATSDHILFRRGGTMVMSMPDPFSAAPVWTLDPRGGVWSSMAETYRLDHISLSGDTVRTVTLGVPNASVTEAERDSAVASFRELAREFAGDAQPNRGPEIPELKPSLKAIHVDDEGFLWTEPFLAQGAPPSLDVFDPQGRYLGRVSLPVEPWRAASLVVRGNNIAMVTADDLGVQYVVRLAIEGR